MSLKPPCAGCSAKDEFIKQLLDMLMAKPVSVPMMPTYPKPPNYSPGTSFYDRCSCNPKNGGSGVCGCTLGGTRVTCNVA